ncbi:MAG: GIY-YIG nuclease family protein [Flavobacterium sp.]
MYKDYNENSPNGFHAYYVYIMTNKYRTTFYIGVTNDIRRRVLEHIESVVLNKNNFTGRYKLTDLVYYERFVWVHNAIAREKELKGWRKDRKLDLIRTVNPTIDTLIL